MSRKTLAVHEALLFAALELLEEIDVGNCSDLDPEWSSEDDEECFRNPYIAMLPSDEKSDAFTDEDSDFDEADPDRLPRRLLNAPAEISRSKLGRVNKASTPSIAKVLERTVSDGENGDKELQTASIRIKNAPRMMRSAIRRSTWNAKSTDIDKENHDPDEENLQSANLDTPKILKNAPTSRRKRRHLASSAEDTPRRKERKLLLKVE
jgi:hypothetical protein